MKGKYCFVNNKIGEVQSLMTKMDITKKEFNCIFL